jgi:hypoxanthine-DNA glycosylase
VDQAFDRKTAFEPVANAHTRVLLLGSLPGEISLQRRQYYANPTNQFWRLMAPVVGADLTGMAYEARLAALLSAGVGLWDVIGSAKRAGSLDSAIRHYSANSLQTALGRFPSLRALAFNGGKALAIGRRQLGETTRVALVPLPSSSAAYCAMPFETKLKRWAELRSHLA